MPEDFVFLPGFLDAVQQAQILQEVRQGVMAAPLYMPKMPRTGKPMSVRMSNFGALGWVTDKDGGYRYQPVHPATGNPWPSIPQSLLDIWSRVSGSSKEPEACLVNFYDADAKMGLHQDRDEKDFSAPVVSISLGDTCLFKIGGTERGGSTTSIKLVSGDVVVLAGKSRLAFHGVTRIYPGTSTLLKGEGRINLTLRRVNP
jgi:DNA oxidative demethylase